MDVITSQYWFPLLASLKPPGKLRLPGKDNTQTGTFKDNSHGGGFENYMEKDVQMTSIQEL